MVQLGSAHHLYFASVDVNNPIVITSILDTAGNARGGANTDGTINGTGKDKNAADVAVLTNMNVLDGIRDVNVGGSNNTVNTTTREAARAGFSTKIITTSESTMTVQQVYPELSDSDPTTWTPDEKAFRLLLYCFVTKRTVFGIDLDGELSTTAADNNGRQGIGGNYSVGFSMPKPVEDLVVVDWQLELSTKPQWIIHNGTNFVAID